MICSFGYSQDLLLGFETGESGGVAAAFGGAPATTLAVGTGTNTSRVCTITGAPGQQVWQGHNFTLTNPVNLATVKTMTMEVFSTSAITILVKVTGGQGGAPICAAPVAHSGGGWENVSFTFNTVLDGQSANPTGIYTGFVIHTYWATGATTFGTVTTSARTFSVDNIRGPLGTIAPPPVVATPNVIAPVPPVSTRPQGTVRSIFSDSYTPVATMGYAPGANTHNTEWCPGVTSLYNASPFTSNAANRIVGLGSGNVAGTATTTPSYIGSDLVGGCEGIDFQAGRFDATAFTHLHIDVWTPIRTMANRVLTIKLSNWNTANTGEANGNIITINNTSDSAYRLPSADPSPLLATGGQFLSFDIPLSAFVNGGTAAGGTALARNNINQMVLEGNLGTVYYDNLYFWGAPLSTNNFSAETFKVYPNPASTELTIDSANNINNISVINMLGQEVFSRKVSSTLETINISNLQSGIYLVKVDGNNGSSTQKFTKN